MTLKKTCLVIMLSLAAETALAESKDKPVCNTGNVFANAMIGCDTDRAKREADADKLLLCMFEANLLSNWSELDAETRSTFKRTAGSLYARAISLTSKDYVDSRQPIIKSKYTNMLNGPNSSSSEMAADVVKCAKM